MMDGLVIVDTLVEEGRTRMKTRNKHQHLCSCLLSQGISSVMHVG